MHLNNSPQEILEKIQSSKRILLSLHGSPDGDSLGSSTALKYWLEHDLKKEVTLIAPEHMGEAFRLYSFYDEVEFGKRLDKVDMCEYDLVLLCDFARPIFYSEGKTFDFKEISVINIDHHDTNPYFGTLNYVDSSKGSACSVLLHLFKKWEVSFDEELSTRLLLGIYTDSLLFTLREDALLEAAFLTEKGARYLEIVRTLKFNQPLSLKKYQALATKNFKIVDFEGAKIGSSIISKEELVQEGLTFSDVRLAPNYLQEIGGIDFLFTLQEMDTFLKGSFRTTQRVHTSLFAKEFGGGGHRFAAGFTMPLMSLEEGKQNILDVIKKVGIHRVKD